jgi:hypothetical protein
MSRRLRQTRNRRQTAAKGERLLRTVQESRLQASPADPQTPLTPLTEVRLTLVQGERIWELGTADADRDQ